MLLKAFIPINSEAKNTVAIKTHLIKSISLPVAPKVVAAPKTLLSFGLAVGVGLDVVEPEALVGEGVGDSVGVGLVEGVELGLEIGVAEDVGLAEELASSAKTEFVKSRLIIIIPSKRNNFKFILIDIFSAYKK